MQKSVLLVRGPDALFSFLKESVLHMRWDPWRLFARVLTARSPRSIVMKSVTFQLGG